MTSISVVKQGDPVIRVVAPAPTLALHFTGVISTGWQQGTGMNMATGSKIYIGPGSGTPSGPVLNDIWIQTS